MNHTMNFEQAIAWMRESESNVCILRGLSYRIAAGNLQAKVSNSWLYSANDITEMLHSTFTRMPPEPKEFEVMDREIEEACAEVEILPLDPAQNLFMGLGVPKFRPKYSRVQRAKLQARAIVAECERRAKR